MRRVTWRSPFDKHRMRICRLVLSVLALCLAAGPALAHRAHAGLTEIAPDRSGRVLEITHRLFAHDLEPVLFHKVYNDWAQSPQGVARVGAYSAAHFALTADGKPLALDYVGAEPEGEFIYIYFTAPFPKGAARLGVADSLLMDVLDDQVNLVNLTLGGKTQSHYFRYGDAPQTFALPEAAKN